MTVTATEAHVVTAAAAGDPAALERLVTEYLPLVYNIVGRALPVAADVDDVVQETMLCVVRGLPTLRDTGAFRSWLVAVTMNQVRSYARDYGTRPRPLEESLDVADPGADFADLTLTELGLTGQRREVAMATAWLDLDDRELLSLWWLAEAGHLTRGELVTATGLDPHHVTVRIARMKAQLETSRAVVRALCAAPICWELSQIAMHWPGRPEPLWRKRFARHIRQCHACAALATDFVPAERLLVRLPLVPAPFVLAYAVQRQIAGALHAGLSHPMASSFQPTQVFGQHAQGQAQQAPAHGQPAPAHAQHVPTHAQQAPSFGQQPMQTPPYGQQPPTGPIGHTGPITQPMPAPVSSSGPGTHLSAGPTGETGPITQPIGPFGPIDQPPTGSYPGSPPAGYGPAPHSHRRIPKSGARTSVSHLAGKVAVALAATAAVVGAAVVASSLDNPKPDAQAGGTPDAVLTSTPGTSADPSATATSSAASFSATASNSTTPSTSHSSSPKSSASTSQNSMKPTSAPTAGNSPAATSAGHPPAPSTSPSTASTTAPSTSPSSSPSGQVSPEDQVLALINQARADQGLAPLTRTAGLDKSAAGHTSVMASGCGLSHQCPGEPGLGARETAAGVSWSSAGENIGDGGPVANTNDAIAAMALGLTKSMLAERPPDDGHRRNILSSGFHHIGISAFRDSDGTVWMTQDFSD